MNGEVDNGGGSPGGWFWEEHHKGSARPSSGRPSGAALELGCARGDDAVWLARRGCHCGAVRLEVEDAR